MRLLNRRRSAHDGPPGSTREPAPTTKPAAAPHDRVAGLGAWLLQVDRRLNVRSYLGAAAVLLAFAAGVVALVIALSVRGSSATNGDVQALRDQISAVDRSASQAAQSEVRSLDLRLRRLQVQVSRLSSAEKASRRELTTTQSHIHILHRRISSLRSMPAPPAGAGAGAGAGGTVNSGGGGAHSTLNVSETEYHLAPANPTVNAGAVKIVATNDGKITHSLAVQGPTRTQKLQRNLAPGASGTLTVNLQQPGTYQWYCPIPGHRGLGMKGAIVVK